MAATPRELGEPADTLTRMQAIFAEQRRAFDAHPMPEAGERIARLRQLRAALLHHRADLEAAVSEDFGHRASTETLFAEILTSAEGIDYAARRVRRWMRSSRRRVGLIMASTRARVRYQPLGVVGIIAPWNYPILLALSPLTYALAAGNRAMLKVSEFTPRTAEVLDRMVRSALGEDEVAVITGDAEVGAAFSALPFDHLLFTGSTGVGRHVMRAAAGNLTPVTLELGGKSPVLIAPDADLGPAAERICYGKTLNAGQTCVAPDYVLVPRADRERLVAALTGAFGRMYPGVQDNDDYTSIIDERHYERIRGLIEDARRHGARVIDVSGGREQADPAGRKLPLHLVLEATDQMKVMQEEIFGPVLPVLAYDELGEALEYIRSHPRPLALNLYTRDASTRERVLRETHSGSVSINDSVFHVAIDDLPFGGIGPSGMGQYHGREGFLRFSHARGVFERPRLNTGRLVYPPYGRAAQRWLARLFLRR